MNAHDKNPSKKKHAKKKVLSSTTNTAGGANAKKKMTFSERIAKRAAEKSAAMKVEEEMVTPIIGRGDDDDDDDDGGAGSSKGGSNGGGRGDDSDDGNEGLAVDNNGPKRASLDESVVSNFSNVSALTMESNLRSTTTTTNTTTTTATTTTTSNTANPEEREKMYFNETNAKRLPGGHAEEGTRQQQQQRQQKHNSSKSKSKSKFSEKLHSMMEASRLREAQRLERADDDNRDNRDNREDHDDDDDSHHSATSSSTTHGESSTVRSNFSEEIAAASRRGVERADSHRGTGTSSPGGSSAHGGSGGARGSGARSRGEQRHRLHHQHRGGGGGSSSSKQRRKKRRKKHGSSSKSKQRDRIRFVVETSAVNAAALPKLPNSKNNGDGDELYDDGPVRLPRNVEPFGLTSSSSAFNLEYRRHAVDSLDHHDGDGSTSNSRNTWAMSVNESSSLGSLNSRDSLASQYTDASFGNSVSLPSHKYQDKERLSTTATSKFEKGLYCVKRRRYSLARSKFRAALKARILLHEDVRHLSIAPVHEMLGMVERKLKEFDKARLHLGEALEICEGELGRLTIARSGEKDDGSERMDGRGRLPSLAEQDSREEDNDDAVKLPSSSSNDNVGSSIPTKEAMANIINDDQRDLLLTNIERIKKTIDIVERDAKKEQIKEEEEKSIVTASSSSTTRNRDDNDGISKLNNDDGGDVDDETVDIDDASEGAGERVVDDDRSTISTADSILKLAAAVAEREKTPSPAKTTVPTTVPTTTTTTTTTTKPPLPPATNKVNKVTKLKSWKTKFAEKKELAKARAAVQFHIGNANSDDGGRENEGNVVDVHNDDDDDDGDDDEILRMEEISVRESLLRRSSFMSIMSMGSTLEEIPEAKYETSSSSLAFDPHIDMADDDDDDGNNDDDHRGEVEENPLAEFSSSDDESLDRKKAPPPQPAPPQDKKRHHQQQSPQAKSPKMKLGGRRMATYSETKLRRTYLKQSEQGEGHYNAGQYAMAIACFNDAKFALLIIAGMPQERKGNGKEGSNNNSDSGKVGGFANLKDQINSALLSERITDCQVQKFTASHHRDSSEDDFSHVNYRQAAAMVTETKALLTKRIESYDENADDGNDGEEGKARSASEVDNLRELLNEAILSLARIFSKQGMVYAKLDDHNMALDLFRDSISAWEEAADKKLQGTKYDYLDVIAVNYDPLILETQEVIGSYYEETQDASRLSHGARALQNTTHLKALSTALQMANSHHALGVEAMMDAFMHATDDADSSSNRDYEAAIHHHLNALKLTQETERMRGAFNVSMLGTSDAASRMTTRSRDLTVLMTRTDSTGILDAGEFMKQCALLVAQQQICISHACFRLGLRVLSKKWLSKAIISIDELELPGAKEEVEVAMYILSVMTKNATAVTPEEGTTPTTTSQTGPTDRFSLYEGGLPVFTEAGGEKPRMLLHFAMAALEKGLHMDAMDIFDRATMQICSSSDRPEYYDEVFDALNAQIIIELKEGNMDRAVREMTRRLDVVSNWMGDSSFALAKDLHRLACFYSVLGQHQKCVNRSEESLRMGPDYDGYDMLESSKLLATTHDAMNNIDAATTEYELALGMEKDFTKKAILMNALSHLHLKVGGQIHIAVDYLEKSLQIQEDNAITEGDNSELMCETMILYGNAMASKDSFTQAIYWYESALNSNPDKSPIQPSNLRALYNKGVTLLRSGDMNGAGHAFQMIREELDSSPTVPAGATFVLNAIGNFYFAKKDYTSACKQFNKALSLKNDDLSSSQRAGTFCNIATAYYRMGKYEQSERILNEALRETQSSDDHSLEVEATIMCRVAYILFKRKLYLRAYNLYTEAASIGDDNNLDDELINRCDGYAETCRLKLIDEKCDDGVPARKPDVIAEKPRFQSCLIPITDRHNASRYGDAVCSHKRKILTALGVELSDCDSIALSFEDTKVVCDRALEYLLEQTKQYRAEYVLEFEGLLDERMNSNFMTLKSLLNIVFLT